MSFDFLKHMVHWDDEDRFARICESIEEVIHEVAGEAGENKVSDLELMQALDFVGFNLFRDNWEEFKKMEMNRDLGGLNSSNSKDKNYLH